MNEQREHFESKLNMMKLSKHVSSPDDNRGRLFRTWLSDCVLDVLLRSCEDRHTWGDVRAPVISLNILASDSSDCEPRTTI